MDGPEEWAGCEILYTLGQPEMKDGNRTFHGNYSNISR